MTALHQAVRDYLAIRRAMGYKLEKEARLLPRFADFLEERGAATVTTELAVAWARLPADQHPGLWAARLSIVRLFAAYLQSIDPATEVPPADLLPLKQRRATPYLYRDEEIAALLAAADGLRSPLRALTYRTLIALLAVTGLRTGEALGLDRGDLDLAPGLLVVRNGKFGKSREVPLHPTTARALRGYLRARDRLCRPPATPALFITTRATRLHTHTAQCAFRELAESAGLERRPGPRRPRLHDLRHTFAVRTLLGAYRSSADVKARLALLSTYLGHGDPRDTYWYLSAAPELLAVAAERLERHLEGPQ
jgi:integrase/recombinase XerD